VQWRKTWFALFENGFCKIIFYAERRLTIHTRPGHGELGGSSSRRQDYIQLYQYCVNETGDVIFPRTPKKPRKLRGVTLSFIHPKKLKEPHFEYVRLRRTYSKCVNFLNYWIGD
jgi:hypothetical protein